MSRYGQEILRRLLTTYQAGDISIEYISDLLDEFTNTDEEKMNYINEVFVQLDDLEFNKFLSGLKSMNSEEQDNFRIGISSALAEFVRECL
jgi:hypothetical protein